MQGTAYSYRVFAHNGDGDSDPSSILVASTPATAGDSGAALAFAAQANAAAGVSLSWTASAVSGTTYSLYRARSADTSFSPVAGCQGSTALSFEDSGLERSTSYSYRLVAKDGSGIAFAGAGPTAATTRAYPFVPLTGALTIPEGKYKSAVGGSVYSFKAGNKLDVTVTAGGYTITSSDLAYTYDASGKLAFSLSAGNDYLFKDAFTVTLDGVLNLVMPGYKKTSGSADCIEGTYSTTYKIPGMGTSNVSYTFKADGTATATSGTSSSTTTWDRTAGTVSGYTFALAGGSLYLMSTKYNYAKQP